MTSAAAEPATGSGTESATGIDEVIAKLLEVRGSRPGKQVNLTEAEIRGLCTQAREIFMAQPVLLELEAPIKICGTPPPQAPFQYPFAAGVYVNAAAPNPTLCSHCVCLCRRSAWAVL